MADAAQPLRFLRRLRFALDPGESHRIERWLATTRVILAVGSLLAVLLDTSTPPSSATLVFRSLLVYVLYSVALVVVVHVQHDTRPVFGWTTLAIDLFSVAGINLFAQGPYSPFFAFFIFVLLTAAYRWGFRATVWTAAATSILLGAEEYLQIPQHWRFAHLSAGPFDVNRFILRCTYLVLLGLLVGYLAEADKRMRAQTAWVSRVLSKIHVKSGLRRALQMLFAEILQMYEARKVLLVAQEKSSGRLFSWEMQQSSEDPQVLALTSELYPSQQASYLSSPPLHTWHVVLLGPWPGIASNFLALDAEGRQVRGASGDLPDSLLKVHRFRSLAATSFSLGQEWDCRLLLFDPALSVDRQMALRFLQRLMSEVGPAVYNVYLLRRVRSQAWNLERSRIARELHDSAIQSLIAAEMRVDVLRRQIANGSPHLTDQLAGVQDIIHKEVMNLRDVMERIKPMDVSPRQFLDFLADLVEKFRRETGIATRFFHEAEELVLSPRVCREVARIVQEGLVNVRKHSGARNVLVWLGCRDGQCKIVIDDDGTGFDFPGRFSQAELDMARKGPAVIKERVRSIGGELTLLTAPGRGARLEITVPLEADG